MGDLSTISRWSEENVTFAFNDMDFSDRILRLEITPDDDAIDSVKKLTADKYNDWFSCIERKDSESSNDAKITTLHICSLVLAAKSPFFYKLFKNGMRESRNKNDDVCFKINASEEATFMDLIRFMYGETALSATSFLDLVDLLIAADKFEVFSCMSHCVQLLLKFPMSLESAIFTLELPSSVLVSEIVKPLIGAAKQCVLALYKNFTKSHEEAMQLPLSAVEVVLGSQGLQVASEDNIFDFVMKWARTSYPELEERRGILTNNLAPLIYFQYMSVPKLKEALACADFDHEQVSKLVHEALFSKVERYCGQSIRASSFLSTIECGSPGRVYSPRCAVFFDLTKNEVSSLSQSKRIDSSEIRLGRTTIYFSACFWGEKQFFGLFVHKKSDSEGGTVNFEMKFMTKSSREFVSKLKVSNHTLGTHSSWGSTPNLVGITRYELLCRDCDYFIDDILRLRIELTLT